MQGQVAQAQNTLKQKEKEEEQLQGNINELKQLTEQKKKQIEALQGDIKTAVSQKVVIYLFTFYGKKIFATSYNKEKFTCAQNFSKYFLMYKSTEVCN